MNPIQMVVPLFAGLIQFGEMVNLRRRRFPVGLVGVLAGLVAGLGSVLGATYTITNLGTLGGNGSIAFGINAEGTVVGGSLPAGGLPDEAFRYQDGVMTGLGTLPGATTSWALGINKEGVIVGHSYFPEFQAFIFQAFRYSGNSMVNLGTLGGRGSSAFGLNDAGWIVGSSELESGETRAFLYRDGVMTNLGTLGGDFSSAYSISASGVVVGESRNAEGLQRAFRFDGTLLDLGTLGGPRSAAYGINASNVIVGGASLASGSFHAFRYDGALHDLGTLGGSVSAANAINSAGVIVGNSTLPGGMIRHAFIYDGVLRDLNDLIPPGSGWILNTATGINERGQIVGQGEINGQLRGFLLTPNLVVRYTVRPDGSLEITSDGFLYESATLSGIYIGLGVKSVIVAPGAIAGSRFYQARES
ncbi:MAG: HAF repeat-containing protein [Verrucomicrobia bacterium]|nr:HAF repeat-containing protein [Verrucomicrobiota bacterium]